MNGDGALHIVVTDRNDSKVSVFRGNGDGTFMSRFTTSTGSRPFVSALGRFNADSFLDVVVPNLGDNNISMLLNNGNGSLQPTSQSYQTGSGTSPAFAATGDFNRDGNLDVAVTLSSSDKVSVWLGNGNGSLQEPRSDFLVGPSPLGIAVADLNEDGKLDLVTANNQGASITVLIGTGLTGSGAFMSRVPYDAGANPTSVAVADLNTDTYPDVVVTNAGGGNNIGVFLGNRFGTLQPQVTYPTVGNVTGVIAADMNGDNRTDIVVTGLSSNKVAVLLNITLGEIVFQGNFE